MEFSAHSSLEIHDPTISAEVIASLGAAARHLHESRHREVELSPLELDVLEKASLGWTVDAVAREHSLPTRSISTARDTVIAAFDTRNMAAAVNHAIFRDIVLVDTKRRTSRGIVLDLKEQTVLQLIAAGETNKEIAQKFYKNQNTFARNTNVSLFKKLAANGRTHSVRRAYELGIFQID